MDKQQKQSASSTNAKSHEAKPGRGTDTPSTGGHPLVFLLGALSVAVGGALVVLPAVAREQAGIVNSFAKHGITGLPLVLTGVVLCTLAIVTRKKEDTSAARQAADQGLLLEQLASDMAVARGGMQELRVEYVYLKDQVQTAMNQRETLDAQAKESDPQAAMFRLAGSMDQLTGRIEMRMKSQDEAQAEQFAELRSELGEMRARVDELRARIEEGLQSGPAPEPMPEYDPSEEPQIEIAEGYQPSEDDLEVTVELEEVDSNGLGLLDEFDDHGRHSSRKQSASIRPLHLSADLDGQVGLLPSRLPAAPRTVDQKLAALRELMSDPVVRQALEAARRA